MNTTFESPRLLSQARMLCATGTPFIGESLTHLSRLLDQFNFRRVMLVIDRAAAAAAGATESLPAQLADRLVCEFDAFTPNPKSDEVERAARLALEHGVNGIVAFGGGSCLDVAKVAALACGQSDRVTEIVEGGENASVRPMPVIAVPTTSGTGSEATHFAAIYVRGRKVSVAHPLMRPTGIVLDVALHMAMPPRLAATTGLDALCQAVESTWAVGSTEQSHAYAQLAGPLVAENLVRSVRDADREARTSLMWGAHLAGRAINISKTTASHAMSYQLTTRYGTPHGIAAALTLGHLAAANARVTESNCADPRGVNSVLQRVRLASEFLGVAPEMMPRAVAGLLRELGVASTLKEAGVPREDLPVLAERVDPVRLGNNPRRMTTEELTALLEDAWGESLPV